MNDQARRLLSNALLSIAAEQLSKAVSHVRDTDKKALIDIFEASQHELAPAIAKLLRESLNVRMPQSVSAKSGSATKPRVEAKAEGGFGLKHVVVALTLSAIGGAMLLLTTRYSFI